MRSVTPFAAAALAAAALAASAAAASESALRLTPLARIRFPDRAFVLSMPTAIDASSLQVRVTENGRPARDLSIVPAARAAARTFGVVLVLDASDSMRGTPIAAAVSAARVFASRQTGTEALGLITFTRAVHVVVQPTARPGAVERALNAQPQTAEGTHLYDAAAAAIDLLRRSRIDAGSVVLLTDGADTGSVLSLSDVVQRARNAGVRVFAVGLRSQQFSPGPLTQLAQGSRGVYFEARSPASLAAAYAAISGRLSRDYLVRYRSLAGPAQPVVVRIAVNGIAGSQTWSYTTPALPTTAPPYHRSSWNRLVSSPLSVLAISILAGALAWFAVAMVLRPGPKTVRDRIDEIVRAGGREPAVRQTPRRRGPITAALPQVERVLQRRAWWRRFADDLEVAQVAMPPAQLAAGTVVLTVLLAVLLGLVSGVLAVLSLLLPALVLTLCRQRLDQRRGAFETQLPDNLTVLAASLRAGHSFVGALSSVVDEADEPSRSELRRAVADQQLGVPVEDTLLRVAQRMDNGDLEQVALVAAVQRESGGNTAEVLDAVVETLRERFELRRTMKTLTAQGRMTRWVLTLMPIAVGLLIAVINPGYLSPLFHTTGGQTMLAVATTLLVIGSFAIKRIMDVEI